MRGVRRIAQAIIDEGMFQFVKHPKPGLCQVKFCRRRTKGDRCLCSAHHQLRYTRKHPVSAYFANLRRHATDRGIPFCLTIEEFRELTKCFNWKQYELPHGKRLSVDRIDSTRGYEAGNVQVLTVSENSRKARRTDYVAMKVWGTLPDDQPLPEPVFENFSNEDDNELIEDT